MNDLGIASNPEGQRGTSMLTPTVTSDIYETFIRQSADKISIIRRLNSIEAEFKRHVDNVHKWPSDHSSMSNDWRVACAFVASQVLFDEVLTFDDLDPGCYQQLERTWLHEIKSIRSYFAWEQDKQNDHVSNYLLACKALNCLLLDKQALPASSFSRARDYVEKKYLTRGVYDETKERANAETRARASRAWEFGARRDAIGDWIASRNYLAGFYENIIPAVVDKSEPHTENVLQSFRRGNRSDAFGIIGCFEALLAICFLDKAVVRKVLQERQMEPPL